jgi:hypothetical protein
MVEGSNGPRSRLETWSLVTTANGYPLDSATLGDRGLYLAYQARVWLFAYCATNRHPRELLVHADLLLGDVLNDVFGRFRQNKGHF